MTMTEAEWRELCRRARVPWGYVKPTLGKGEDEQIEKELRQRAGFENAFDQDLVPKWDIDYVGDRQIQTPRNALARAMQREDQGKPLSDEDRDLLRRAKALADKQNPLTIHQAIRDMDPDDALAWTKSGKPRCSALHAALGFRVSAKERDAAWKEVNA